MAPAKAPRNADVRLSGKITKSMQKRTYTQAYAEDLCGSPEPASDQHDLYSPCQCLRRPGTSYANLDCQYDFELDLPDILENYLSLDGSAVPAALVLDNWNHAWESISQISHNGMSITVGTSIMLQNGTFLRVKDILHQIKFGETVLRGHRLIHTRCLQPILDNGQNDMELLLDYTSLRGSDAAVCEQSLVDVPLCRVRQIVTLHISNYEKPPETSKDTYFCRWKLTRFYQDYPGKKRRGVEIAIEKIRSGEADSGFRISDDVLRCNWRGRPSEAPSLDDSYSALDGFCCGGGWSRGAELAGNVKVVRSFDIDEKACRTYRMNFPFANCLQADVFQYCLPQHLPAELREMATTPEHIDIAHYSTPCQFFSPAHTRPGPNDDKNVAASFCLGHLLDKDRPRVVTFENTSGLERQHFQYLKAIFGQVTSKGYSLRFSTLRLADYGLPQNRRRLIMLAACPGEVLPTFPLPTHSENASIPGTLDWVSAADAIKHIPSIRWQNHHPSRMSKMALPPKIKRLLPTLTCSNTPQEVHPDGRRYTLWEYQLLQGFPLHHRFANGLKQTHIRAQIGNAFPPSFVKQLVRHIRKQLQRSDGLPETFDEDEFWDLGRRRQWEIDQFLKDHDNLPEGTRPNLHYVEPGDDYDFGDHNDEDDDGNDSMEHLNSGETLNSTLDCDEPRKPRIFDGFDFTERFKRARTTSDQSFTQSGFYARTSEESSLSRKQRITLPTTTSGHGSFTRQTTTHHTTISTTTFATTDYGDNTTNWLKALPIRPRKPGPVWLTEFPLSRVSTAASESSSKSALESDAEDSNSNSVMEEYAEGTNQNPIVLD